MTKNLYRYIVFEIEFTTNVMDLNILLDKVLLHYEGQGSIFKSKLITVKE